MKTVLTFLVIILYIAISVNATDEQWDNFKLKYNKHYASAEEEATRKKIFEQNLERFEKHNERFKNGLEYFTIGVNTFADLTTQEIEEYTSCAITLPALKTDLSENATERANQYKTDLSDDCDWVNENKVTPAKDQKSCGSCWDFAAVGAIESRLLIGNRVPSIQNFDLSEQEFLDCTSGTCNGGTPSVVYNYAYLKGMLNEISYPYVEVRKDCNYALADIVPDYTLTKYAAEQSVSEEALAYLVRNDGPVVVLINVDSKFGRYDGVSIYQRENCSQVPNHAVLIVGFGSKDINGNGIKTPYWRIKNSWGPGWGDNGYGYIIRGSNMCGIANYISYPVVN